MATWPSDEELSKLSDEHKAMLAQKCVGLLMRKCSTDNVTTEVYAVDMLDNPCGAKRKRAELWTAVSGS